MFLGETLLTHSTSLSVLVSLTLLLYPGCPLGMMAQTAPQRPATLAQSRDAAELQSLLDQHRYIEFADKLLATDPTRLTGPENQYFSGMLAFHLGQLDNAAPRLIRAVNTDAQHSLTPAQDREALATLAGINLKLSFYSGAAKVYGMLSQALGPNPGPSERAVLDNRHLAELLAKVPPQTVELTEDFTLSSASTVSEATGAEYTVGIPGQAAPAKPLLTRFDTGAELSVLSASTAKTWGVTMLDGTATLLGAEAAHFRRGPASCQR